MGWSVIIARNDVDKRYGTLKFCGELPDSSDRSGKTDGRTAGAFLIKTITNTPIEVSEEEEEIEMCKAIEDLIAESEARGRAEGEVRGRAEGETRGEAKGMIEICLDMSFSKEDILKKLQEKLNISLQQAGEYFEMYGKHIV